MIISSGGGHPNSHSTYFVAFTNIFTLTCFIHKYFSLTKSLSQGLYPEQNCVTFLSEIFLSQSHPYKDSALVLSSTQNRVQTDILSVSHNFLKIFCICRCCQLSGQYETELFSLSLLHILSSCFVFGDVVSLVVSVRLRCSVSNCCTS